MEVVSIKRETNKEIADEIVDLFEAGKLKTNKRQISESLSFKDREIHRRLYMKHVAKEYTTDNFLDGIFENIVSNSDVDAFVSKVWEV